MSEPAPEVSSDTNALLRLQLIARECPHRALGDWLWEACRRVLLEGVTLDAALGLRQPGWQHPRQVVRHDRRDDLLCDLYDRCYRGTSLVSAATIIAADHARLLASWGRMRPRLDLIPRTPRSVRQFHELFCAEGHGMPRVSQLRRILRRAVVRPVGDLPPVEIASPPAAASADDAAESSP